MDRQDPLASLICLVQAALFICRKFWLTDSAASGLSFHAVPIDTTCSVWFNLASSLMGRMAVDALCTFVLLCIVTRHARVHHFLPRTGVTEEQVPMCLSRPSSRAHLVQMQFPMLAHGQEAESKDPTVKWAAGSWRTAKKGWALLSVIWKTVLWDLGVQLCLTQSTTTCCRCWQCWTAHSTWNVDTFSEYH